MQEAIAVLKQSNFNKIYFVECIFCLHLTRGGVGVIIIIIVISLIWLGIMVIKALESHLKHFLSVELQMVLQVWSGFKWLSRALNDHYRASNYHNALQMGVIVILLLLYRAMSV